MTYFLAKLLLNLSTKFVTNFITIYITKFGDSQKSSLNLVKDFSQYCPLSMVLKKIHQDCHDICHQIRWFTKTVTKFGDKNPTLLITKHPSVPSSLKALTIWEISKSWPVIAKSEWKLTKNGQCWQYDQELLKIATTSSECCKQHYNDNCDEENFLVRCQIVCKCLSAWYNGTTTAKDLNCRPGTNTETEIPISRGTRAHLLFCLL